MLRQTGPVEGRADSRITFAPLRAAELPLLASWLDEAHVHRWWNHETTPEALERDFGPTMRGEEPNEDLLVRLDGRPVGLVQRCRWEDYPEYAAELDGQVELPAGALSIDYLLGPVELVGRGVGPAVIRAVCADAWVRYRDAAAVVVPVAAGNVRSWRALEKAGFRRVAEADLEPDNPVDDRVHIVYRLDRPRSAGG